MIKEAKCVIWDLDNTLWNGILSENDELQLKLGIIEIIKELDRRGILNSIASKNNAEEALKKLDEFNLTTYFLYPQINWNAKSHSVKIIQEKLNIGIDSIMFIDDQTFELDEVKSCHADVDCVDALLYADILKHPRLNPRFITLDSQRRRQMYIEDIKRNEDEKIYDTPEAFLASLSLQFTISKVVEADLQRAEELTLRSNQLNTTGITYSYENLLYFMNSPGHELLVCELTDKYGSYGKIGLALIEKSSTSYHIKLLLMSCRVISRGVGTVLLYHIMQKAKADNMTLKADFKTTGRNKMMYITYKFANFYEETKDADDIVFFNSLEYIPTTPKYIDLQVLN